MRVIVGVCALLATCAVPPAFAGPLDTLPDAQIAARFAPRLVLHADERYAPTSTDELLQLGATLVNRSGGLVRAAPLTPALLPVGSSCVGGLPCAYALRLGCGLSASTPCPAPADAPRVMYARVVRRHPARAKSSATEIMTQPAATVAPCSEKRLPLPKDAPLTSGSATVTRR